MMNCISYISSAAIISRSSHVIMRSSFYGFSSIAWRRGICRASVRATALDSILTRFPVQYFSTVRARSSRSPKVKPKSTMEDDSNAFYVVRKGDIIGIYKSLSDCQAQVSSSVCDPSVSVYKGYSLPKQTEEYLASRGLKNPLYSMHSVDVKEDLFGTLVPCPFKQPDGLAFLVDKSPKKAAAQKKSKGTMNNSEAVESSSFSDEHLNKFPRLEDPIVAQPLNSKYMTCIIEFDGASKGNPGKAGAGAVLRTADGSVVSRVREGLGIATNNVAEYRALILGMKYALKKGFQQIQVQGDSRLVCMQVQELWQTKHPNMADLCKEAKRLKDRFLSFKISHVLREFNSDADAQANLAINLPAGEVYEECGEFC
ncbi:uncharacterized protein M6B38_299185 [Iris pallida]|uniref:RNase H type-1 domain-containing protein n=1 Tax=Iris pallida TaxID=29817 RepID=A0AAX6HQ14_IRIPA|nr:uncharacterized protein M6B38_378660 [Iris pallida]KAJ6842908.1 uncharacterized protein M6B38_299185 [Iris pallida]